MALKSVSQMRQVDFLLIQGPRKYIYLLCFDLLFAI